MASTTRGVTDARDRALEWVTADRVRMFATLAAGLVLVALVCLLIGSTAFNVLAALAAVIAAASALVAVLTWVARRRGVTNGRDLWDRDVDAAASAPEDVFRGFSGFREDA